MEAAPVRRDQLALKANPDLILARLLLSSWRRNHAVSLPVLTTWWARALGYSLSQLSDPALRKKLRERLYRRFKPAPQELLEEFELLSSEIKLKKLRLVELSLSLKDRAEYLALKSEIKRLEARLSSLHEEIRASSGSWVRAGLAWVFRADGLIWIQPSRPLVDLMLAIAKNKQHSPRRFHRDRRAAIRLLATRRRLKDSDWLELYNLYSSYLEDTSRRVLVFEPIGGGSRFFIPYKHRFTYDYARKLLARFDSAWNLASCFYSSGVFLSLTLNPSDWPSILSASKALYKLFNRFLALLARKPSPSYILLRVECLTLWLRILEKLKAQHKKDYKQILARLLSLQDLARLLQDLMDPLLLVDLPLLSAFLEGSKVVSSSELSSHKALAHQLLAEGWLTLQEFSSLEIPSEIKLSRLLAPLGISSSTDRLVGLAQLLILLSIPRLGERLDYISVPEPHDSGMPHLHVVLFGISRLGPHHLVSLLLRRLGFGMVHHACSIKQKSPGKWSWAKSRPKGAKSSPPSYLRKYLKKMLSDLLPDEELGPPGGPLRLLAHDKIAWFWATGKRFFTCSRRLLRPFIGPWRPWRIQRIKRLSLPPAVVEIRYLARPRIIRKPLYRFVGVFYREQLEDPAFWLASETFRSKLREQLSNPSLPRPALPQLVLIALGEVGLAQLIAPAPLSSSEA